MSSGAQEFTPVMPPMQPDGVSFFKRWMSARKNLLSVWTKADYKRPFSHVRFLRQQYVVCSSPDTVRQVLLSKNDNYGRKSPQERHALEPLMGDGLFVSDGPLWVERRQMCSPPFLAKYLPSFSTVMTEEIGRLAAKLEALPNGTEINVSEQMNDLTGRIIGKSVFGTELGDHDLARVVTGFSKYLTVAESLSIADTVGIPFIRAFEYPLRRRKMNKYAKEVQVVLEGLLQRVGTENLEFRSAISIILDHLKPRQAAHGACPMSPEAMRNEAVSLFIAGHETSANTLAWVWYLLDGDPKAAAKLHAELETVLQGRQPTLEDVPKLVYTRAVIDETMRLYPSVALLSRQARNADKVGDIAVEPGAIMLVASWLLHRNRLYWKKPDQFCPERFLPGAPRVDKFAYIPFSAGHRVCLGQRFAQIEMVLCVATLAQKFRLRLKQDHAVEVSCKPTIKPKGGLPMTVERRNTH